MSNDPASSARSAQLDECMELMHFGFRRVVEGADRVLLRRGLGRLHHRILYVVAHNPGLSVGQLVTLLGVSKQALHAPVRSLIAKKLLAVKTVPTSRRTKALTLTARGEQLERQLAEIEHAVFEAAFATAGAEALQGWHRVMDALAEGRRLRVGGNGHEASGRVPAATAASASVSKPSSDGARRSATA